MSYTVTKSRVLQYIGIILIVGVFAGAYWYFQVFAGVKVNSSLSDPLSEGLAGYWKLDDGSGTSATDSSTNGNTGTLTNGPTWGTGQIGGDVDFDGTNDYVTMGDQSIHEGMATMTLSGWIKMDALPVSNYMPVSKSQGFGQYRLNIDSTGIPSFVVTTTNNAWYSSGTVASGSTALTTSTWVHLLGTYDGQYVRIYVNGVLAGTGSQAISGAIVSNTAEFRLGYDTYGNYFNGQIDEVRLYNRALSVEEVTQLYRVNSPTGVDTNLKGYWTFDGADMTSTIVTDQSGAGNNGTLTNGPTVTQGKVGQALSFDGSNDYVTIPNAASLNSTAQVTVSAWIKRSGTGTRQFFVSKGNASTVASTQYWLELTAGNVLVFELASGSTEHKLTSSFTLTDTQNWHHVVGTYDGTTQKIFLDGVQDTTTSTWSGALNAVANDLVIGNRSSGYDIPFNGKVDEVRVYNTALTAAQIQSLYKRGESDTMNVMDTNGNLNSGLAGYWKLDEGSGTSAVDSGINGSTGTLTNGPTWTTGQIGSAVDFDGTDDYIDLGTPTALDVGAGAHSVSAWVKTDVTNTDQNIFTSGSASCCGVEVSLAIDYNSGGGYYEFGFAHQGAGTQNSTITGDIQTGTWYFVTGTWDGSTRSVYVNGVLHSTAAVTGLAAEYNNNARIGRGENSTASFDGQIDEVRVYSRAISATEVAQLYRYTGPAAADSGLVGYWSFNGTDTTSTKAYDRSGSGNTGTLSGGTTSVPGKIGQAMNFSGAEMAISLTQTGKTYTFSTWAKLTTASAGYFFDTSTGRLTLSFGFNAPLARSLSFYDGNWKSIGTANSIPLNEWVHLVWVFDNSNSTAYGYINGALQGTAAYTGKDISASTRIGNHFSAGDAPIAGSLDEVRIYSRALSASEIQAQYKAGQSDEVNTGASQAQGTGRLDSGLAGYWKLDEGSGTSATDSSTNSNTGTLTNGPTWTTGQIGGAVTFDGTDDRVVTTHTTNLNTYPITVSTWVKTSVNDATRRPIVSKYSFLNGYALYMSGGKVLAWYMGNGSNYIYTGAEGIISTTTVSDDAWHNVVFTVDIVGGKLYVDGKLEASRAWTGTPQASTTTNGLGLSYPDGGSFTAYLAASIDDTRIYNRALSADEVAELSRLNAPIGTETGLKGYWSFNGKDVSGTTAYDRSGAGNTGTLTNGPTVTPGKLGQALRFDGTDDYVLTTTSTAYQFANTTFTVTGWFKTGSSSNLYIASQGGCDGGWRVRLNSGTLNSAIIGAGNCGGQVAARSSTTTLDDDEWHHFVAIFTTDTTVAGNNTVTQYVDGVLNQGSLSQNGNPYSTSSNAFQISGLSTGNRFSGILDEVRVYNRALTAAEITSLYNASK